MNRRPSSKSSSREGAAVRRLRRVDPRLGEWIDRIGACKLPQRRGRYAALIRAIVAQQVSTKAAAAVFERIRLAAGGWVTADRIDTVDDDGLRVAGLSRQKLSYVRDLTSRVRNGSLRLERLTTRSDEEIIEVLTEVKGLGRWSAEMFLIFVLNRPDVLPVGDLGIQNGFRRVYRLPERPSVDEMHELAEPWRPYRTFGSWYLWRATEVPTLPDEQS